MPSQLLQSVITLVGDAKAAHRIPLVAEVVWGLQACRLIPLWTWLNCVGTFGVGTIGYWWAREAAIGHRLGYGLVFEEFFWALLMDDDFK